MTSYRWLKYRSRNRELVSELYAKRDRKQRYEAVPKEVFEAIEARAKAEVDAEEDAIEESLRKRIRSSELWPLAEATIEAKGQPRYRAIEAYNEARQTFIEARWIEQGLSFCTGCQEPKPKVRPYIVEGQAERGDTDCRYNSWTWFEKFCRIDQLCKKCCVRLVVAPHQVTSDGKTGNVHTSVWPAEERKGKWWVKRAGFWMELKDKVSVSTFVFDRYHMVDSRIEKLEQKWNVPPALQGYPTGIVILRSGINDPAVLHFDQKETANAS